MQFVRSRILGWSKRSMSHGRLRRVLASIALRAALIPVPAARTPRPSILSSCGAATDRHRSSYFLPMTHGRLCRPCWR